MRDVTDVLNKNMKEAIELFKKSGMEKLVINTWCEEDEEYNGEDCYIRYADDDGDIRTMLVLAIRYNKKAKRIEIVATSNDYEEYEWNDDDFFPLMWADDISYWRVLEVIAENLNV